MKFRNPFPAAREAVPRRPVPQINWVVFLCMALLLVVGVFFVRSATAIRTDATRMLYQEMLLKWIPLGLVVHATVAAVDYRKWNGWAWAPYLVVLVALGAVVAATVSRADARRRAAEH